MTRSACRLLTTKYGRHDSSTGTSSLAGSCALYDCLWPSSLGFTPSLQPPPTSWLNLDRKSRLLLVTTTLAVYADPDCVAALALNTPTSPSLSIEHATQTAATKLLLTVGPPSTKSTSSGPLLLRGVDSSPVPESCTVPPC